ncbi:MAG: universal stress protein [Rickettsiaceae bacterium]|nr:universal stress protein [Rickettsiaceae bacterium]MDP4832254.1 universal stress protein [Rickettsiaceae bacterium]MDP5021185.1 universal stress protein [Rickettsiaceae bacterium]MDP5083576.1 universal stress protein [Rickettsiaceae bacterium]
MFKNIIIPVDLSDKESIKVVFPAALNFVNAFGSKLHLVHIMPNFGMKMVEEYLPRHWMSDQKEKYNKIFDELVKKFIPEGIEVEFHISRGAIYDEIINYSEKLEADLIILSAVRPQLRDYMLGPNASKIVRHSSISVLVVRD